MVVLLGGNIKMGIALWVAFIGVAINDGWFADDGAFRWKNRTPIGHWVCFFRGQGEGCYRAANDRIAARKERRQEIWDNITFWN